MPTVITTSSGVGSAKSSESITTNWKVSTPGLSGAVKVGDSAVGSLKVIGRPSVCVQPKVRGKSPSGSWLPLPSRVTVALVSTFWSSPASAIGAWLRTVITTSSGVGSAKSSESVTTNSKVSTAGSPGAAKVGDSAVGSLKIAVGPPICVQPKVRGKSPSGSWLPLPSKTTVALVSTPRSSPASATGIRLPTAITTLSGVESANPKESVTTNSKVSTTGSPGAAKVGDSAVGSLKETAGPPACTQP